ncbi:beta-lactamase family protein [Porticoccaceae bacterium]|nr:beta-lactamase family protein [Porticoccaceae bacterium]
MYQLGKVVWFAAFFLGIGSGAIAETVEVDRPQAPQLSEELSKEIAKVVDRENIVGAAVALVNEDGVFWAKGFGYAEKESSIAVTPDTLFRAGSTGKSITSLIAMRLVEEGLLDLTARLRDMAPEITFTNKWEEETPVRLVHLLEHTTGWDDFHLSEYRSVVEGTTLADGLAINPGSRTSRWPPGRYPAYSNSGPAVMGYVLEKITGENFETLAQRYVFQPLGIDSATFNQTEDDFARLAKSYSLAGAAVENTRIWASSAGTWAISAREFGRLVQLYIRRGEIDGARLISPEGMDRIEGPKSSLAAKNGLALGYGLGNYATIDWMNKAVYHGHDGGLNGFQAVYAYRKDVGVGYVILMNSQSLNGLSSVRGLVQNYLGTLSPAPTASGLALDLDVRNYEGLYQAFTPRNESARMLFEMSHITSVYKDGDHLFMRRVFSGKPVRLTAFGNGRFAPQGVSEADRIFYMNEKGEYQLALGFDGLNSVFRKVSPIRGYGPAAIFSFFVINAIIAFIFTFAWVIGRLFGKFRNTNRWRVWTFPILSFLVNGAGNVIAVIPSAITPNAYEILGTANFATRTIQLSGILTPVLAAFAVFMLFKARNVSRWARWHAGVATLSILMLSALLFYYDQVGLPFWAYSPITYERYVGF